MKKLALNFSIASDGPPRKDLKKKEGRVMERVNDEDDGEEGSSDVNEGVRVIVMSCDNDG